MAGTSRFFSPAVSFVTLIVGLFGCSSSSPPSAPAAAPKANSLVSLVLPPADVPPSTVPAIAPVMLGIDVLEADGFAALKGKRVGLLTHPAGVNRRGESTIDVLRRAPGVKLVALFGMEHGIYNQFPAEKKYDDHVDSRTGLKVFSLYKPVANTRKPSKAQLKGIDALVVDLQDIGTRSYTFVSAMKRAMEGCFENGVEVIVLDRPNPLGGLKVDGPLLDQQWMSYVGAFRVPYVHGLTAGELARMAKDSVMIMEIPDKLRQAGKLTVIPMRGWRRSMRWPDTGLTWVPTSTKIQDWAAVQGYPMVGLGCYLGQFSHGIGTSYWFRVIEHPRIKREVLEKELRALNVPGLQFRAVNALDKNGQATIALYIEISDYDEWRPTELNFHLMKLACKYEPKNPFAAASKTDREMFLRHMGSTAFFDDLVAKGARIDVDRWLKDFDARAKVYQQQSRRYWLYQ